METVLDVAVPGELYAWEDGALPDRNEPFAFGALRTTGKRNIDRDTSPPSVQSVHGTEPVYVVPSLMLGDSGGEKPVNLHRSNQLVFLEEFGKVDGVHEISGGGGWFGVAIRADVDDPEILETLRSLEDYPVLDDEAHSALEIELQNEAWEDYLMADFVEYLEAEYSEAEGWDDALTALAEAGALSWALHDWLDAAGLDWYYSGLTAYFDPWRLAQRVTPAQVLSTGWNGWARHYLNQTIEQLDRLLGGHIPHPKHFQSSLLAAMREHREGATQAVIDGLYDEGFQPALVLGAVDEQSLLAALKRWHVEPETVLKIAERLGADPGKERRYEELANRFTILREATELARLHKDLFHAADDDEDEQNRMVEEVIGIHEAVIEAIERIEAERGGFETTSEWKLEMNGWRRCG